MRVHESDSTADNILDDNSIFSQTNTDDYCEKRLFKHAHHPYTQ